MTEAETMRLRILMLSCEAEGLERAASARRDRGETIASSVETREILYEARRLRARANGIQMYLADIGKFNASR